MTIKTYSELSKIETFFGRYEYLRLPSEVGKETFGSDRFLNQIFYHSSRWRKARDEVIVRDNGFDMGVEGFPLGASIIVHHINPITKRDIDEQRDWIFDPEFLICVSRRTHQAIHFSDASLLPSEPVERRPFDTCPWRR